MLKFKQTSSSRPQSRQSNISADLSTMKLEPCKATVIIKNISLPLAWPAAEYFEHRGDLRDFNVCLNFKAVGGKLLKSKLYQRINRTTPDIKFDEHFTFPNLTPDFTIEAMITAKRVDTRNTANTANTFSSVSRSFGKKFGTAFKKYNEKTQGNYTISAINFSNEVFKSPLDDLIPIGRCFFRIENAGLSGKIRIYSLTLVKPETIDVNFNSTNLLPLFGTICCQIICIPNCLTQTLIRSCLDIYYVDEKLILKKLNSLLINGQIKCYTKNNDKTPGLTLPIDKRTKIRQTAYKTSLNLKLYDDTMTYSTEFMLIFENLNDLNDWVIAIKQQILNSEAWEDFASEKTNLIGLKHVKEPVTYFYYDKNDKNNYDNNTMSFKTRTITSTTQYPDLLQHELYGNHKQRKSIKDVFRNDDEERKNLNILSSPNITVVKQRKERPSLETKKANTVDRNDYYSRYDAKIKEISKRLGQSIDTERGRSATVANYPNTTLPKYESKHEKHFHRSTDDLRNINRFKTDDYSNRNEVKEEIRYQPPVLRNDKPKPKERKEIKLMTHVDKIEPPPVPKHGKTTVKDVSKLNTVETKKPILKDSSIKSTTSNKQRMKLVFEPLNLKVDEKLEKINNETGKQKKSSEDFQKKTEKPQNSSKPIPQKPVDFVPPVIVTRVKKDKNGNSSKNVEKNTYVIRLSIGMNSDDDEIQDPTVSREVKTKNLTISSSSSPSASSSSSSSSSSTENKPPSNTVDKTNKKYRIDNDSYQKNQKNNNKFYPVVPITKDLLKKSNGDVIHNNYSNDIEITRL